MSITMTFNIVQISDICRTKEPKDVRTQKFPRTDFNTLTARRE